MTSPTPTTGWRDQLLQSLKNGNTLTTALALSRVGMSKYLTERKLNPSFAKEIDEANQPKRQQW